MPQKLPRQFFHPGMWIFLVLAQTSLLSSLCWASSERREFEGIVQFEARYTVVPMVICQDLPGHCPKPEPYWSLTLQDSGIQAEWTEPLAFGKSLKPRKFKVLGKWLKPGARVRLQGEGSRLGENWFLIENLEALEILD